MERAVIVTGGVARLGAVIADHLVSLGWRVIRSSHRADPRAEITADLSSPGGAEKLFSRAKRLLGGRVPDALVNNAALFALDDTDVAALNFSAPKRLTELMAERDGTGAVVNILDTRILNSKAATPYEKSKAALRDYTLESARIYAGVLRVNAVAPGPVLAPVDVHESAGRTPFGRPKPEDVASAVAFLLDAPATTGSIIPVDGGQLLSDRRLPLCKRK